MGKVKLKKRISSCAYSGSLLQNNFGESIKKGYLIWDIEGKDIRSSFRTVLNDHGFVQLHISRGENIEDRVNDIELSHNPRKTKVQVFYQDYEENFSQEKLFHIEQLIKLKYGCEVVKAYWKDIEKEQLTIDGESSDISDDEDFQSLFEQFLETGEFDVNEKEKEEILGFALDVDNALNISYSRPKSSSYEICEIEVSNIYSFPVKPTKIS